MHDALNKVKLAAWPDGAVQASDWVSTVEPVRAPLPLYLSALGMLGQTAYFGLLDVGLPKAIDTVFVSGAAGAVGSVIGQIVKIKGVGVVGIAGGADKYHYRVDEMGFDAAIDHKTQGVA